MLLWMKCIHEGKEGMDIFTRDIAMECGTAVTIICSGAKRCMLCVRMR